MKYAQVKISNRQVVAVSEFRDLLFVPVPEDFVLGDGKRYWLRNSKIEEVPMLTICVPDTIVAHAPFDLSIDIPPEIIDNTRGAPPFLDVSINNDIRQWKFGDKIIHPSPETISIQICGPWPYFSHKAHATVVSL